MEVREQSQVHVAVIRNYQTSSDQDLIPSQNLDSLTHFSKFNLACYSLQGQWPGKQILNRVYFRVLSVIEVLILFTVDISKNCNDKRCNLKGDQILKNSFSLVLFPIISPFENTMKQGHIKRKPVSVGQRKINPSSTSFAHSGQ